MLKKTAVLTVKMLAAKAAVDFLWGFGFSLKWQHKHGLGTAPTKQQLANAYFGIK